MKALVSEITNNLKTRLSYLGIDVREMTGESELKIEEFNQATIIVSTPEKWNLLQRKSYEKTVYWYIDLLIIDEVHMIGEQRGVVLEEIVTWVHSIENNYQ